LSPELLEDTEAGARVPKTVEILPGPNLGELLAQIKAEQRAKAGLLDIKET
jgi:hypothetical protein